MLVRFPGPSPYNCGIAYPPSLVRSSLLFNFLARLGVELTIGELLHLFEV